MRKLLARLLFLLVTPILAWSGPSVPDARAQDDTYKAIAGIERVRELVGRIDSEGAGIPSEIRQGLLVEGRAIVEQDRQAAAGLLPLQTELKESDAKFKLLADEKTA